MMKIALLVLSVLALQVLCSRDHAHEVFFKSWMKKHNKSYLNETETQYRLGVFKENLNKIAALNREYSPRTKFAVNKFADLTQAEFKATYLKTRVPEKIPKEWPVAQLYSAEEVAAIPDSFDWRTKGAVTPVKDQGQCGSCWSFSTTGNVEGQWFLAGHKLVTLSEQNLVDCDHECMEYEGQSTCDAGCEGGLMPNAFNYIIKNGGIDTEDSYAYNGVDGTCSFTAQNVGATIKNWTMISQDESQIATYLYNHGPVSIAADAELWQFYFGGVFYVPLCGTTLDHGILIVGYGVETDVFGQQMPYWIVKNSWGADWGESGYIRIERGNGECGVNLFACSSIV